MGESNIGFDYSFYEDELEEYYIEELAKKALRYGRHSKQFYKLLARFSHNRYREGLRDLKAHNKRVNYRAYLRRLAHKRAREIKRRLV